MAQLQSRVGLGMVMSPFGQFCCVFFVFLLNLIRKGKGCVEITEVRVMYVRHLHFQEHMECACEGETLLNTA